MRSHWLLKQVVHKFTTMLQSDNLIPDVVNCENYHVYIILKYICEVKY
jgi:hypothetical protein